MEIDPLQNLAQSMQQMADLQKQMVTMQAAFQEKLLDTALAETAAAVGQDGVDTFA